MRNIRAGGLAGFPGHFCETPPWITPPGSSAWSADGSGLLDQGVAIGVPGPLKTVK